MPLINEVLNGRYLIIRQLGQGGMGTVYEANDNIRFNKPVALKEILIDLSKIPDLIKQETVRRAFEREAKILTQVDHEAFPQVIDYFTETDRQYLVMELVQGDELGELLEKRQTPFAQADVLKWADQLLDALDYLHTLTSPIIHRDIKPQNIKLTPRGKIKLLDFGIAKGNDTRLDTLTNQTFIAATLNYSPIEQVVRVLDISVRAILAMQHNEKIAGIEKQTSDTRSDIYALGATLYHLLTKQLPVDALKRSLEVWAGKPDPLIDPQEINPSISLEISDWLLKAMAVDSENRFISASEMRQAINQNFAEIKNYEIKDQKHDENIANKNYPSQKDSKTEPLLNKPKDFQGKNENISARKKTEEVTSLLPLLNYSSISNDTFEKKQILQTQQNLLSNKLFDNPTENISQNFLPANNTSISVKKNTRLFLIISVLTLVLLSFGGAIWVFSNKSIFLPVANSNSNINNISNNSTSFPNNNLNNFNVSNVAENTFTPINNKANTVKKTDSRITPTPKKIVTPTANQKHITPPKKTDTNCIFNDNCH